MSKKLLVQLAIGLGIVGIVVIVGSLAYSKPYRYQGSVIEPPIRISDITLTDQFGGKYQFGNQKDTLTLLFFGYTHCPDVCPTTLYDFKQIKERLGDRSGEVSFVFITVDPERDTPEVIAEHLKRFDPEFIGLNGSLDSLEEVYDEFGVYRAKQGVEATGDYFMDHTARIYVLDRQGKLRLTFPYGMEFEAMLEDIEHLVEA